jgi:malate dehydrogenase
MTTAAIIGAGDLGGAVAHALATREAVDRVLIVDEASAVAEGKALDIQQSGAVSGFHTRLAGSADLTRVAGCDVCILADRAGSPSREWQGDPGLAQLVAAAKYVGDRPVVLAGTGQADLLSRAVREASFKPARLVGSSPEALASAVRAIVAMEARCSPGEVGLAILGAPPDGFVLAWSEASIGGYALEAVLTQVQMARIEARTRRLWPPQPYALGMAAAMVAEAIVGSARRAFNVLALLEGEFGVRNRVGTLPVLLSTTGIVHRRVPSLSTRERVRLETVLGS